MFSKDLKDILLFFSGQLNKNKNNLTVIPKTRQKEFSYLYMQL